MLTCRTEEAVRLKGLSFPSRRNALRVQTP